MAFEINHRLQVCIVLLLVTILALATYSCGRKKWPAPQLEQEVLAWGELSAVRNQQCLQINAELQGKHSNLQAVVLELEGSKIPCLECPLQPTQRLSFSLGSQQVQKKDHTLSINYCELDPDLYYRFRLLAENIFPGLEAASSKIITADEP